MNIKREITQIKNKLEEIEKELNKPTTIEGIKIGEQFIYKGHNYTKLSINNFCIIDDYDECFMECMFDPISNNYEESLVRYYINSDRFIEKLGADIDDLHPCYDDENYITLLSKAEYGYYRSSIRDWKRYWATRSSYSTNDNYICAIDNYGGINHCGCHLANATRVCFILKPNTPVARKCNK